MRRGVTVLLISALMLQAGEITVSWELPRSGVEVRRSPVGEYFHIDGIPGSGRPGNPSLPLAPLYVVLPCGSVADAVTLTSSSVVSIPGTFDLKPAQAGVPLSRPEDFVLITGREGDWASLDFPQVTLGGQGSLMGYNILAFTFRPVNWDPEDGTARVTTSALFTVEYHEGDTYSAPVMRSATGEMVACDMVRSLVLNPGDATGSGAIIVPAGDLEYGDYLIIVPDALVSSFEPLAEWKTLKGIPASIVPISTIDGSYPGVDTAQKIRCFLRTIYSSAPPTFVLLAGDTPGVAHRNCWATAEGYVGDPAADIYYQDMNDTAPGVDLWDANINGVWGEIGIDVMDYHPDYLIGRASVETAAEASIFVNRIITYEDGCDSDAWFQSMGFTTGILWTSPYCPGSAGKEKVDTLYTPPAWSIEKHYQSAGTQSYALTMDMLNRGQHLVNHAGHGSTGSVSIGTGTLDTGDFMGLTNISGCDRPSIWNSIACNSGGFDEGTCLAEAWIRSPGGGGFCMMNTRYGWGEPTEPGGQWSDLVDQEFFAKFFIDDLYLLGEAHAMAKDEFVALIPSDTHYDWIAKSLTLFGDPELPMWSELPDGELQVEPVMEFTEFMLNNMVTVTDGSGPVENARVCILQGVWDAPVTYVVAYTDASGIATLDFSGGLAGDPSVLMLTGWARNHSPVSEEHAIGNLGLEEESSGIDAVFLLAHSPNPATGSVKFTWCVPPGIPGTITVHDLAGRVVATIGSNLEGSGTSEWDLETDYGQTVPAGLYFARLSRAESETITRRMIVMH
jgi:hypothetical protein